MKIVVCDDDEEDLAKIERLLTSYRQANSNIRLDTEKFLDAETLYQKIQTERHSPSRKDMCSQPITPY